MGFVSWAHVRKKNRQRTVGGAGAVDSGISPSPKGGRRRTVDDRAALNGILYVLQTGIPWEDLPQELGFGSGMTCWRRLRDWQAEGVWEQLHLAMLRRLRAHDRIDWERASLDGASVPSPRGGRPGGIAGWLSARMPGSPASANCAFVSSGAST